jgi:hypothetical protein
VRGILPLSLFIARATGSPFSHTGIVAIEDDSPVVYDCSSDGVQRLPFEVRMLDCVGSLGVKRLRAEHRRHIPGVIGYCRKVFERQVPFDPEFRLDDSALYCLELTEKAFRSQGLALSEPVRIGDFVLVGGYGTGPDIERDWLPAALHPYRDRVHFTGWLPPAGVAPWYRAADILVVPSWYEPFGLVVLEGMLHGLAPAAGATGGPAAILEDGRTGLLFPPKDIEALAGTLLRLVRDGDLRRRLGTAAAREVRRNWLRASIVTRIAAVYREAVEESPGREAARRWDP